MFFTEKIFHLAVLISGSWAAYHFPPNFKFGVTTSAYQIEGGAYEDGKGQSVWDRVTHANPPVTQDGNNGDIACDSYHQWKRDVEMIKQTGVHFYKFSLAWTRLFPRGFVTKYPNRAGVTYYKNLIKELKANGIEPVATLYYWDLPQTISSLGGLANPNFITFFVNYARTAFELFGEDVKTWITFNSPKIVCQDFNRYRALKDPWYPSGIIEYECSYNIIKAHAEVYHVYDKEFRPYQNGRISIALNLEWSEPGSDVPVDYTAAYTNREFEFSWYASPLTWGQYPTTLNNRDRSYHQGFVPDRLEWLTEEERIQFSGTVDFIGLVHFSTWMVRYQPEKPYDEVSLDSDRGTYRYQPESWPGTGWNKVVPWGLRKALAWIKGAFANIEIQIYETGFPDSSNDRYEKLINDDDRIDFLTQYLNATMQAIYEDKVNVTAFTVYNLMDSFEWQQGYNAKFGLFYVNFTDDARTRIPKKSVGFLNSIITNNRLPSKCICYWDRK